MFYNSCLKTFGSHLVRSRGAAMLSTSPRLKMLGISLQRHYSRYVPPKYATYVANYMVHRPEFYQKLCTDYKY